MAHTHVVFALAAIFALGLGACKPVAPPTPAQPTNQATEVIQFSPDSITPGSQQQPVPGACEPSLHLPRPGAYRCVTAAGATFDPCFALAQDDVVGCDPNPVAGAYAALVTPDDALPVVTGEPDPLPFYLNLGPNKPFCAIGPDSPMELEGQPVTFACQAPGAWIVGPLKISQPTWWADYVTTNTQGSEVTYGPEESAVVQAWVY